MPQKFFNNDKGVSTAIAGVVVIVSYLFLMSFFITFFTVNIYGSQALESTSMVELPTASDIRVFSNSQNYTSCENDKGLLHTDLGSTWENICGIGLRLMSKNMLGDIYALTFVDYLHSTDGVYTNEYLINNSVKENYMIVLRHGGFTGENLLLVENNGFCIQNPIVGCKFFYNYPNANQYEEARIKTIYTDVGTRSLQFYFNNEYLFQTTELNTGIDILSYGSNINYAGVGSQTIGFTLKEYYTPNPVVKDESGYNILTSLVTVVMVLVKMSTWSLPSWILPIMLQQLMISLPEALLVICIAVIIRGN